MQILCPPIHTLGKEWERDICLFMSKRQIAKVCCVYTYDYDISDHI